MGRSGQLKSVERPGSAEGESVGRSVSDVVGCNWHSGSKDRAAPSLGCRHSSLH
jgi:hypothetical protein